jgi:putative endonuclease
MGRFRTIAVYIMTDKPYGTLYTGVTAYFVERIGRHRAGEGSSFTAKYNCKRLVWYEVHEDINVAIQREKSIKRYSRQWKINLIEGMNPGWNDLWSEIVPRPLPGQWRSVDEVRRGKFPGDDG